jgi:hypothetical protein
MSRPEEIFKCEVTILAHRPKAVKIRVHDEEIWIPRSQIIDDEELPEQGDCEMKMTAWIAKQTGLR